MKKNNICKKNNNYFPILTYCLFALTLSRDTVFVNKEATPVKSHRCSRRTTEPACLAHCRASRTFASWCPLHQYERAAECAMQKTGKQLGQLTTMCANNGGDNLTSANRIVPLPPENETKKTYKFV